MKMTKTIADVAKKAGVSIVTASRVINGVKTVRENNKRKVLQAMEELDYQPNHAARVLASGKTGVIGLTIGNLNDRFLEGVVKAVNSRLEDFGYFLALSVVPMDISDNFLFQKERVDGIIMLCPTNEEQLVAQLKKKDIPFILLDNQKEHDVPSVVVDNLKGGYEATKHLIDMGHKKIGHIGGPGIYLSSQEREKGFLKALDEKGLPPFMIEKCDFSIEAGFKVVKGWIEQDKVPSAIFAADDFIALGAINALTDSGYRVPRDVSVVGYDDQLFASEYYPKITTIKQPEQAIGEKGVDLLMDLMRGNMVEHSSVTLEPSLIIRESTKQRRHELY